MTEEKKEEKATVEPESRSRALEGFVGMMEDALQSEKGKKCGRAAKTVSVAGLKVARSALDSLIQTVEKRSEKKKAESDEGGSRKIEIE